MADRHGVCTYPGVLGVIEARVTFSHGITPARIVVICQPQENPPAQTGDVVFTDGVETVTIPGCRLDEITVHRGGGGATTWTLYLRDRRWRWEFGSISGFFNQLDSHAKLLPWTIRSAYELAELCLAQMRETNYRINLPTSLPRSIGQNVSDFLTTGNNFPPTGLNPPINWVCVNPANALQNLAEMFGARVIYNLREDAVYITPVGQGAPLPEGSVHVYGPTIKGFAVPDAVTVKGAPTRYQMRLWMANAVGLEWDERLVPINELSYAPRHEGRVQTTRVTFGRSRVATTEDFWILTINGLRIISPLAAGDPLINVVNLMSASFAAQNNDPRIRGLITIATDPTDSLTLIFSGSRQGFQFDATGIITSDSSSDPPPPSANGGYFTIATTPTSTEHNGWERSMPGSHADVRATDRLTYAQALDLARKSVFKYYQLSDTDCSGEGAIRVPGLGGPTYGTVESRHQIVILDTKVEQVVPTQPDERFLNPALIRGPDEPIENWVLNFYNGRSHDKPAVTYGSFVRSGRLISVSQQGRNTPYQEMFVPFTVDPNYQVVKFSEPVFYKDGSRFVQAHVTLETAVHVRNRETNDFERFEESVRVGTTVDQTEVGDEVIYRPDVQMNIIGDYEFEVDEGNFVDYYSNITGTRELEQDARARANYYLQGMLLKYQLKNAETADYNGIVAVALDGAISQITWEIGGGRKASTKVSRNCEHSSFVPPYPTRRREENLRAVDRVIRNDAGGADAARP